MAVKQYRPNDLSWITQYAGLSTDTKPTPGGTGAEFWESDTSKIFRWNGAAWVEVTTSITATISGAAQETTLLSVKTAVEKLDDAVAGSELQVDVVTSALPSGAATGAKQDTGNNSLASLVTAVGEVQASPTENTILDRLKDLLTGIVLAAGTNDIGNVGHLRYTTVKAGEIQGAAAATQLPTVTCKLVRFKARGDNAGNVYLGVSGVTKPDGTTDATTGFELDAGDETGWIATDNLNRFYRICDNAGDDLTYMAVE